MKSSAVISSNRSTMQQAVISTLLSDVEKFRFDAKRALGNYSRTERSLLESIEAPTVSSEAFLAEWSDNLKPQLDKLESKMTDTAFSEVITKSLLLSQENAQEKIYEIISQRKHEILDEFLFRIYPMDANGKSDIYAKQRERARVLLDMPVQDIKTIQAHQADYLLYTELAKQNAVTIIDPHDSLFTRIRKNKLIKAERKSAYAYQKKRIQFITERLAILASMHKGLLVQLHDKQLDLVTIFDMRHQYEKKLTALTGSQKNNPVKHLAIFETVTQKYIAKQTERLAGAATKASLEETKKIAKELETVLLQIFDLSNAEKNQLLLYAKEYRELTKELDSINAKS